jgi:uncharacterized protein
MSPSSYVNSHVVSGIQKKALALFNGARGSHDWEHTLRVVRLCELIGQKEKADMEVLLVAAYLHDVGRCQQDLSNGKVCHAEIGAQLAAPLVGKLPIAMARQENILHCIRSHRFRGHQVPQTLEAQVLFDADKLDAIGAVGVARAFLFAGEVGARLHAPEVDVTKVPSYTANDTGYREYQVKLMHIKDRLITRAGRRLAEERHTFMETFFNRFLQEYEGKR